MLGDAAVELLDISGNVTEFGLSASPATAVATILVSDIVDSTGTATRVGDAAWRQFAGGPPPRRPCGARTASRARDRHDGRRVPGPPSTACSRHFAARPPSATPVRQPGLEVRIRVHTGEINLLPDGVRGIAVHAAARVMALAAPSEVVVSAVTHALAAGSGLRFVQRGPHSLRRFPEATELFALA